MKVLTLKLPLRKGWLSLRWWLKYNQSEVIVVKEEAIPKEFYFDFFPFLGLIAAFMGYSMLNPFF